MDLNKLVGKGKLKGLLRQAFIAGGRYYLKSFGRGNIPKKDLGEVEDFDRWYSKQKL